MAQQVQVVLVDDLDGGDASTTVTFGIDGTGYEIDLSDENAEKLRAAISPFVAAGRKVAKGRRGGPARGPASKPSPSRTAEVREWARVSGYTVSDRGRVPDYVQKAFAAAN